jgi:predicted SAM-dependent methyltransferase
MKNQLGLVDMAAYKAYCDLFTNEASPRTPTPEEIALLNPDSINNYDFWRVAEELFFTDPVSNCQFSTPVSKREAIRRNLWLYEADTFLAYLTRLNANDTNLLEIGPGYGSLREWVTVNTRFDYYAVDVHPKIEGIDRAEVTGLMGEVTKARRYDIVVAENVFQHLSINQRHTYYRDVAEILMPNGWFMVSQMLDHNAPDNPWRDKDGKLWMRHYGQFTEIQKREAILSDLMLHFDVYSETRRSGWLAVVCRKKQPSISL